MSTKFSCCCGSVTKVNFEINPLADRTKISSFGTSLLRDIIVDLSENMWRFFFSPNLKIKHILWIFMFYRGRNSEFLQFYLTQPIMSVFCQRIFRDGLVSTRAPPRRQKPVTFCGHQLPFLMKFYLRKWRVLALFYPKVSFCHWPTKCFLDHFKKCILRSILNLMAA